VDSILSDEFIINLLLRLTSAVGEVMDKSIIATSFNYHHAQGGPKVLTASLLKNNNKHKTFWK